MHAQTSIEHFIFELSEIPAADPLVHTDRADKGLIVTGTLLTSKETVPIDAAWTALLKQASQNKREADLDSLCAAAGLLCWNYKGKAVQSPVMLVPLSWKIPKGRQTVELTPDTESAFLNPFVRHHLLREFGLTVAENSELSPEMQLGALQALLAAENLPVGFQDFSGIGNFHHHRYRILRELERIQQSESKSPLVETILGNESSADETAIRFTSELLTPADADQLKAFRTIAEANTVIQGPPGTGKSQVLTNLLGKAMTHRGLTLVVSEKRVALDVLVKKLSESGLDRFTFTAHSQSQSKHFIQQLKSTWQFLEQDHPAIAPSLLLSEQLKDSLQLLLDRLNSPGLIGGVSFRQFSAQLSSADLSNAVFRSDTPSVKEWLDVRPALEELERLLESFAVLRLYKQALLCDVRLDQVLRKLQKETAFALSTFSVRTYGELEAFRKSAARCQLIANESFRAYFELHGKPRERKRFGKVRLQFNDLTARLETLAAENKVWKRLPARSEVVAWQQQLNGKRSWFSGKKALRSLEKALVPTADRQLALAQRLEYLDLEEALLDLRKQLAEWGIEQPETELSAAAYVLRQLEQEDPNELNRVAALPASERATIVAHAERLRQLAQDLWRYLDVQPETDLTALFEHVEKDIAILLAGVPTIRSLSDAVYRLIATGKSLTELEADVLYSNRRLLENQFPELAKFDGQQLTAKLDEILATEQDEFEQFARTLILQRKQQFDAYARILRTPAAQLHEADKKQKARLKAGKAILVKEFGKSKQHLTIRELLSSDARPWIELLTPVWLSTPAQIGATFPMEQGLFQLAVFDEASQIPLPNALGALQRSVRAVVAGDEQQMAPSAYFSGSRTSVDLLHQASYYWKKAPLRHHYRSEHPALIAFSNRHFYDNELVVYPSVKTTYPLHLHHVPHGIYDERTNVKEAQEVARFLENANWKAGIGIVAFSEQQLDCIWRQCSPQVQERITEGQEKNTVFFKALEQIQGDEADIVVVSMGYGKDAEGNFHLRFGPLNQANGHKRLNVLLTRARSELHFFTSVTAADFTISANESVNLLRLFLTQLKQGEQATDDGWPFNLQPEKKGASVNLPGIYERIASAQELVTFHRVMKMRGWKMVYR